MAVHRDSRERLNEQERVEKMQDVQRTSGLLRVMWWVTEQVRSMPALDID